MRILPAFAAAAFLAASAPASAEELTLERIFASPSLSGPTPRLLKLSPDGRLATLLRNRADDRDRYDLWAVDTNTGQARMLVDSARIGTGGEISEEERMRRERARLSGVRGIVSYDWSPDGRSILVPLDGDLYLAALDGSVRRITETAETELDAQVSRTGRYLSFVRDRNLYVVDADGRNERRLTEDGAGTVSWGSAEFVAQEEMDRHTGYWWAPDDSGIAFTRTDESKVPIQKRSEIYADRTEVVEQRYPAAGDTNVSIQLGVIGPHGGKPRWLDLGANPDVGLLGAFVNLRFGGLHVLLLGVGDELAIRVERT